jgi:ribonuclease Z
MSFYDTSQLIIPQHVVSSPEHNANPAAFLHYSAAQLSLQNLDPDMFLLPKYSTANSFSSMCCPKEQQDLFADGCSVALTGLPLRVTPMQAHQVVSAKPLSPPQPYALAGNVDPFHPEALSGAPAPMSDTLQRLMKEAKTAVAKGIESRRSLPPQPGDDVEITSLGTASAVPGRFRNGTFSPF